MFKDMPKKNIYEFAFQVVPCVGFNTRRVTRLVTQYFDKALAPAEIRSTQFSLLNSLSMLGEISMKDLASILAMDRTTLTRDLKPLLNRGLVSVTIGNDRRVHPIEITIKGRKVLELAQPYWEKAQAKIVDSLGSDTWEKIMRYLHQISMIVEDDFSNPDIK
jgi:DNA-binding MarR family transcriptional regulator